MELLKIDIIIPVYNQTESLGLVINGFCNQQTQYKYKLIIVDDGSNRNIQALTSMITDFKSKIEILFIQQENKGRASARNTGILNSTGDIIIFNDSDRIPAPDFIDLHVESLNSIKNKQTIMLGIPREIYTNLSNTKEIWEIVKSISNKSKLTPFTNCIIKIFDEDGYTDSGIPFVSTFTGNMSLFRDALVNYKFDENIKDWGHENIEFGYRLYVNNFDFQLCDASNYHLAHKRSKDFYIKGIEYSTNHFIENGFLDLLHVGDFIKGKISLQKLENLIGNKKARWLSNYKKEIYNILLKI